MGLRSNKLKSFHSLKFILTKVEQTVLNKFKNYFQLFDDLKAGKRIYWNKCLGDISKVIKRLKISYES